MKLVPAKCPSCGANIEVNKELEKTICQYCGTTVLIEDAIQKLKIELSGKVEVDGIKTDKKRLEEAKKHIKLEEYDSARRLLNEILKNDHFNIEAECLWIKNAILMFNIKEDSINYTTIREDNPNMWRYIKEILSSYDKLIKLDEEKEYVKYLKEYINLIDYLKVEYNNLLNDEKKCKELSENINNLITKYRYKDKCLEGVISLLEHKLGINIQKNKRYIAPKNNYSNYYCFHSINLCRNGSVNVNYEFDSYHSDNYKGIYTPTVYVELQEPKNKITSMSQLENKVEELLKYNSVRNLKKWRNENLTLREKLLEKTNNIIERAIFIAISSGVLLIGKWLCSYRSNWYIKKLGADSTKVKNIVNVDNTISTIFSIAIGVIIVWNIYKLVRDDDVD